MYNYKENIDTIINTIIKLHPSLENYTFAIDYRNVPLGSHIKYISLNFEKLKNGIFVKKEIINNKPYFGLKNDKFYWKIKPSNYYLFYKVSNHSFANKLIREYAKQIHGNVMLCS